MASAAKRAKRARIKSSRDTSIPGSRVSVSGNPATNPATNPAARPETVVAHCMGPVRRTTCAPMTGAMVDSDGRRSRWADTQNYWDMATIDARWSK